MGAECVAKESALYEFKQEINDATVNLGCDNGTIPPSNTTVESYVSLSEYSFEEISIEEHFQSRK